MLQQDKIHVSIFNEFKGWRGKKKLQVETDTGCHFNIAGSEVIFYT